MSRLPEVTGKVDAFFARVKARHGGDMQCDTGCSDCCHVRLTITGVEAAAIRTHVGAWPAERRRALVDRSPDRCAALDAAGRCQIYDARPIVCRSHGVPIRLASPAGDVRLGRLASPAGDGRLREGSLPVVQSCHRNFTHTEPDADCVLDQTTVSALVLAVDRDAGGDGSRIALAALVAELATT